MHTGYGMMKFMMKYRSTYPLCHISLMKLHTEKLRLQPVRLHFYCSKFHHTIKYRSVHSANLKAALTSRKDNGMELWTTLSSPLGLAVAAGIILLAYLYYSYTTFSHWRASLQL